MTQGKRKGRQPIGITSLGGDLDLTGVLDYAKRSLGTIPGGQDPIGVHLVHVGPDRVMDALHADIMMHELAGHMRDLPVIAVLPAAEATKSLLAPGHADLVEAVLKLSLKPRKMRKRKS